MAELFEYFDDDETIELEDSGDIYSDVDVEILRDDDEISDTEEGFMTGYNNPRLRRRKYDRL